MQVCCLWLKSNYRRCSVDTLLYSLYTVYICYLITAIGLVTTESLHLLLHLLALGQSALHATTFLLYIKYIVLNLGGCCQPDGSASA